MAKGISIGQDPEPKDFAAATEEGVIRPLEKAEDILVVTTASAVMPKRIPEMLNEAQLEVMKVPGLNPARVVYGSLNATGRNGSLNWVTYGLIHFGDDMTEEQRRAILKINEEQTDKAYDEDKAHNERMQAVDDSVYDEIDSMGATGMIIREEGFEFTYDEDNTPEPTKDVNALVTDPFSEHYPAAMGTPPPLRPATIDDFYAVCATMHDLGATEMIIRNREEYELTFDEDDDQDPDGPITELPADLLGDLDDID